MVRINKMPNGMVDIEIENNREDLEKAAQIFQKLRAVGVTFKKLTEEDRTYGEKIAKELGYKK